ncbi:hypothetical protein CYMTET_6141 [Cymbomonas tetramitiformis]|uniref:SET domain-containing protein n=1 Tax=Cymbomonas tetramitiformis TaxID=36881 RepID=A0AAE0LIQ4_9CHLO|nr:hypothetical protein CYMTET_6141 [Cymbomonas tetramitiformis]
MEVTENSDRLPPSAGPTTGTQLEPPAGPSGSIDLNPPLESGDETPWYLNPAPVEPTGRDAGTQLEPPANPSGFFDPNPPLESGDVTPWYPYLAPPGPVAPTERDAKLSGTQRASGPPAASTGRTTDGSEGTSPFIDDANESCDVEPPERTSITSARCFLDVNICDRSLSTSEVTPLQSGDNIRHTGVHPSRCFGGSDATGSESNAGLFWIHDKPANPGDLISFYPLIQDMPDGRYTTHMKNPNSVYKVTVPWVRDGKNFYGDIDNAVSPDTSFKEYCDDKRITLEPNISVKNVFCDAPYVNEAYLIIDKACKPQEETAFRVDGALIEYTDLLERTRADECVGLTPNCEFFQVYKYQCEPLAETGTLYPPLLFLKATRAIYKGDELLLDYGASYTQEHYATTHNSGLRCTRVDYVVNKAPTLTNMFMTLHV